MKKEVLLVPKNLFQSHGSLNGEAQVITDSRKVQMGDIFIGIKGDRFDGGDYYSSAIELGASVIIVESQKGRDNQITEALKNYPNTAAIFVENSINYIQEIAKIHLSNWRSSGKTVMALTGSNGKTTTKEMLAHLLKSHIGNMLHYTKGNLNNHLGLPFTILELSEEHELALFEIGTNHFGEIKALCEICDPDFGLITNIGASHLEFLENKEGVFREKSELLNWIEAKGNKRHFFLNIDDSYLVRHRGNPVCIEIGEGAKDFNWKCFPDHIEGMENLKNENLLGVHNFKNLSVAISVACTLYPDHKKIFLEAAKTFTPSQNRSSWKIVQGKNIFLDAYNANPSSMIASLGSFCDYLGSKNISMNEVLVVIGDMYELGEHTKKSHEEIGSFLQKKGIHKALFIGKFSSLYQKGFGASGNTYTSVEDAKVVWKSLFDQCNYFFIKGSRGVRLEELLKEVGASLQA